MLAQTTTLAVSSFGPLVPPYCGDVDGDAGGRCHAGSSGAGDFLRCDGAALLPAGLQATTR